MQKRPFLADLDKDKDRSSKEIIEIVREASLDKHHNIESVIICIGFPFIDCFGVFKKVFYDLLGASKVETFFFGINDCIGEGVVFDKEHKLLLSGRFFAVCCRGDDLGFLGGVIDGEMGFDRAVHD